MTVRSPLWDALAIGAAFLLIGGVTGGFAAALACIGTLDREARPVLAARGWLAAREAAAMAWWHARRLPLLGLLYPHRGGHTAKDEAGGWHPPDEEAGDEDSAPDRQPHEPAGAAAPGRVRAAHGIAEGIPGLARVGGTDGEDAHPAAVQGMRAVGHLGAEDAGDDLTGLSAEDTDTLNAIRAINAEHLVPPHEPAAGRYCESGCGCRYGTDDPDRLDCACDGPCAYAEHDEWFGPGCTYHDEPAESPETSGPGPEAGPPGPASAGGPPFAPVTTASCAAEDIAAKGDSTGPGAIIICSECDYPLHPCPDCREPIGHDGYDDHQCAGRAPRQPGGGSGEPGGCRPSGRPPAADAGPDQLSRFIAGYLGAAEAMLPAWGQVLACSMRRELAAGAP